MSTSGQHKKLCIQKDEIITLCPNRALYIQDVDTSTIISFNVPDTNLPIIFL